MDSSNTDASNGTGVNTENTTNSEGETKFENESDLYNESRFENELYIETHSKDVCAIFACVGMISLLSSCVAILVLRRTTRIPYSAKFLSTGLLTLDSIYILSTTVRKFVPYPLYNTSLQVLSTTVLQMAYVTVALMSLERCIMFKWPMRYMTLCTEHFVRRVAFTTWTATAVTFQSIRYGVCSIQFHTELVLKQAGTCNKIVTMYYSALVVTILLTSIFCYWSIFRIVKTHSTSNEKKTLSFATTAAILRSYKSTSLVLVYLFVILCTSFTYAMIIVFIRFRDLGVAELRLSLEIVSLTNCILDPFLYVLWFKESQMEVYKLFSRFSRRLSVKVERMKYDIFDIVTTSSSHSRNREGEIYLNTRI